jgi:hypothetical protein
MSMRFGKFEMIRRIWQPEHHAVEASVILKAIQLGEAETFSVKPGDGFQIICRTCDSQFGGTKHIDTSSPAACRITHSNARQIIFFLILGSESAGRDWQRP